MKSLNIITDSRLEFSIISEASNVSKTSIIHARQDLNPDERRLLAGEVMRRMRCSHVAIHYTQEPMCSSAERDRSNALNTMLRGLRLLQDHEVDCPACSPTPDGDSKNRFAGNGLANQQIGVMSQTFHPVWASELEVLVKGRVLYSK
jgi:hypothetical protein